MIAKTILNNDIKNKYANNTMNNCPCCSQRMLRHARHGQIYWFCAHCHQEMPNLGKALTSSNSGHLRRSPLVNLNPVLDTVGVAH